MKGTKLYKDNNKDMKKYTDCAVWCNNNGCHIEDKGEYYEVVDNIYTHTTEEKLEILDAKYNENKDKIRRAFQDAFIYNDTALMTKLKADLVNLDEQYDSDYEAVIGEDEDDE